MNLVLCFTQCPIFLVIRVVSCPRTTEPFTALRLSDIRKVWMDFSQEAVFVCGEWGPIDWCVCVVVVVGGGRHPSESLMICLRAAVKAEDQGARLLLVEIRFHPFFSTLTEMYV